ncbi:hypothetical protein [Plastoroseomonas hellenica]|uniref:hypothetical protein n=1 Tax=Plastoroseomonas hellenica TaxID=2687306 RepID=UPI001BAABB48|nr:hypothetical protein [Plastoroseomonas hellenica]
MRTMLTHREQQTKLAELNGLLNDPEVPLDPHRVWTLLAELEIREPGGTRAAPRRRASLQPQLRCGRNARILLGRCRRL